MQYIKSIKDLNIFEEEIEWKDVEFINLTVEFKDKQEYENFQNRISDQFPESKNLDIEISFDESVVYSMGKKNNEQLAGKHQNLSKPIRGNLREESKTGSQMKPEVESKSKIKKPQTQTKQWRKSSSSRSKSRSKSRGKSRKIDQLKQPKLKEREPKTVNKEEELHKIMENSKEYSISSMNDEELIKNYKSDFDEEMVEENQKRPDNSSRLKSSISKMEFDEKQGLVLELSRAKFFLEFLRKEVKSWKNVSYSIEKKELQICGIKDIDEERDLMKELNSFFKKISEIELYTGFRNDPFLYRQFKHYRSFCYKYNASMVILTKDKNNKRREGLVFGKQQHGLYSIKEYFESYLVMKLHLCSKKAQVIDKKLVKEELQNLSNLRYEYLGEIFKLQKDKLAQVFENYIKAKHSDIKFIELAVEKNKLEVSFFNSIIILVKAFHKKEEVKIIKSDLENFLQKIKDDIVFLYVKLDKDCNGKKVLVDCSKRFKILIQEIHTRKLAIVGGFDQVKRFINELGFEKNFNSIYSVLVMLPKILLEKRVANDFNYANVAQISQVTLIPNEKEFQWTGEGVKVFQHIYESIFKTLDNKHFK